MQSTHPSLVFPSCFPAACYVCLYQRCIQLLQLLRQLAPLAVADCASVHFHYRQNASKGARGKCLVSTIDLKQQQQRELLVTAT
jgi:hypothetical protein